MRILILFSVLFFISSIHIIDGNVIRKIKDILGSTQKIRFLIVGDGPLRPELVNYAEELGIKGDVTFAGWIKDLKDISPKGWG